MTKKKVKPDPDIAAAWKEYEKVLAAARTQMRYGKDSAHASIADYLRLGAALKAALGREEKLHEERESWARHSRRQRDMATRYRKGLERVLRAIGDEGAAPDELNVSWGPEELCRLVPEMVERLVARERADALGRIEARLKDVTDALEGAMPKEYLETRGAVRDERG